MWRTCFSVRPGVDVTTHPPSPCGRCRGRLGRPERIEIGWLLDCRMTSFSDTSPHISPCVFPRCLPWARRRSDSSAGIVLNPHHMPMRHVAFPTWGLRHTVTCPESHSQDRAALESMASLAKAVLRGRAAVGHMAHCKHCQSPPRCAVSKTDWIPKIEHPQNARHLSHFPC